MSRDRPSIEDLIRAADGATAAVRADAERRGTVLPVWRDGRILYIDPATGVETAPPARDADVVYAAEAAE